MKEKSTKKSFFITFYSPKCWQLQGYILQQQQKNQKTTEIRAKRRLPKGCYCDTGLVRPIFPALVQDSAFSQRFDWVLLSSNCWSLQIFESSDFPALYYIHRKHYWDFFSESFTKRSVHLKTSISHTQIYYSGLLSVLEDCVLPPSPNCTLSCSPHGSWMGDEALGSQKELHSWKMMKPRIHFSFPLLSLADSSHFYHSEYITQEVLTTSGLHRAGCCTNTRCVRSSHAKDKKIITALPQAPPLS